VFALLVALQDFVNDQIYEECAPLATFESAIRVIEYEYRERCVDNIDFNFLNKKVEEDGQPKITTGELPLRFSHTKDVLEGSFLFSKVERAYSLEEHAETR
jgi:hypothetical protein